MQAISYSQPVVHGLPLMPFLNRLGLYTLTCTQGAFYTVHLATDLQGRKEKSTCHHRFFLLGLERIYPTNQMLSESQHVSLLVIKTEAQIE